MVMSEIRGNSSKYKLVWRLLSQYTFEVDSESSPDDLKCIICKRLMVDACQSGCGCQYCYNCVYGYLNGASRYCPGGKQECEEEYLELDGNVTKNIRMNNSICKLRVKCPNESCQSAMELGYMNEHLRVCLKQQTLCPYSTIGCDSQEEPKDKISSHVNNETFMHSELLVECIQNLRNEVSGLKENVELNKLEIRQLQQELKMKDTQIEKISSEAEEQHRERDASKKEKDKRITTLEEELSQLRNKLKVGMEMRRKYSDIDMEEDNRLFTMDFNQLKQRRKKQSSHKSYCDFDFSWKISNWRWNLKNMPMEGLYSESFYAHDYKMCLCLYIYEDIIQIYCYIMKGEDDHRLQWPMKGVITLSIINQETKIPYKSVTLQYDTYSNKSAFDRPKSALNDYIGIWPFVLYSAIKDLPYVIDNDSLVVTFTLEEP